MIGLAWCDLPMESCVAELETLRLHELKEVLGKLGLPKKGNKADLVTRIIIKLITIQRQDFIIHI